MIRIMGCLVGAIAIAGCSSRPHDLVSAVPIGSLVTDLKSYLPPPVDGQVVDIKGSFVSMGKPAKVESNGRLGDWRPVGPEWTTFTGKVTIYHDGTTSADVNDLTYKGG